MTFETPSSASRDFSMPRRPGGSTIAPVAMMQPCPGISRGTEATVPIPPGFVSVIVAPCMSSGDSDPSRVLRDQVLVDLAEARRSPSRPRP